MFIYHPAFDVFHTAFRMLVILDSLNEQSVELERFRIMDFYTVFPFELRKLNLNEVSNDLKIYKKIIPKEANPYENILNGFKILERMRPYQMDAIKFLISYGYINAEIFNQNYRIQTMNKEIPLEILNEWESLSTNASKNALKLVTGGFASVIFNGDKGIKAKSGLLVFRYDPKQ